MRVLRHLLAALLLIVPLAAAVDGSEARAQDASPVGDAPLIVRDHALLDALTDVGMLDAWFENAPHHAHAAVVRVNAGSDYEALRDSMIAAADRLATSRAGEIALLSAIADVEASMASLERLARDVRSRMMQSDGTIEPAELALIRKTLHQVRSTTSHDELRRALETVERARVDLGEQLVVEPRRRGPDKSAATSAVSIVLEELAVLDAELEALRARAEQTTAAEQALILEIEVAIPELHAQRTHASTAVEGLPMVTLDAYLRAGDHGIDGCAVDWTLLAGIGRIESFHGTIGDSTVTSSGRVSPTILGPLLDGGASDREYAAALEAAAEEAAALAAEQAAEAARVAAEEAERRRLLYGGPPTAEPPASDSDETKADGESTEEAEEADGEGDDEEEEEEVFGNGFAVITDTDDGALDGNHRWDRAVGPMQFLPETWGLWERDGNGDGVMDPHNLYDAAAAAAAYLCHLERRSGPSPWVYVLGYNNSDRYVAAVLGIADGFADYEMIGAAHEG